MTAWRGRSGRAGLGLHDHCAQHAVEQAPTVPGRLYATWRRLGTNRMADIATCLGQLQAEEAVAGTTNGWPDR
jgi:hypothetical protein